MNEWGKKIESGLQMWGTSVFKVEPEKETNNGARVVVNRELGECSVHKNLKKIK